MVFCWEFIAKSGCLIVVFWWCRCGGSVVQRGVLAVAFWAAKDAPNFLDLFFRDFRFWNAEDGSPNARGKAGARLIAPLRFRC